MVLSNTHILDDSVSGLAESFRVFKSNLSKVAPDLVPVKKKSFWRKLMFWKKDG